MRKVEKDEETARGKTKIDTEEMSEEKIIKMIEKKIKRANMKIMQGRK